MYQTDYAPQSQFNTELYHHGVPGMKWGVRRYQPYGEGGYTPKNKKSKKEKKKSTNSPHKMTDGELDKKIDRLKKEAEYRRLKNQTEPGRAYTIELIKNIGQKVIPTVASGAALYLIGKKTVGGEFNPRELGDAMFRGGAKKK